MAEEGETLHPTQEASQKMKPSAADSDQRQGISSAFRAAVGRFWRSWIRGPEGMVDTMSKASTRSSPLSKEPPPKNPIQGLDEPSKP